MNKSLLTHLELMDKAGINHHMNLPILSRNGSVMQSTTPKSTNEYLN